MSQASAPAGASGLVIVDKSAGLTSHDVVARIRRLAGTRKVGHAGTLDPMATGVLVIGVNRATRLLGHLMLTQKAYDATIRLGASTTTDDAEGELIESHSIAGISEAQIRERLQGYLGELDQKPTAVSAIKIDGKRAYQRVRDGEDVDLPARRVTIHDLVVHEVLATSDGFLDVRISLRCSSGTYVRAIARDLGHELAVGGHLTALRRSAVGPFALTSAQTLEQLAQSWRMIDLSQAARASFPAYELSDQQAIDVRVGRPLSVEFESTTAVFAPDGEFLALYETREARTRPIAVFVG